MWEWHLPGRLGMAWAWLRKIAEAWYVLGAIVGVGGAMIPLLTLAFANRDAAVVTAAVLVTFAAFFGVGSLYGWMRHWERTQGVANLSGRQGSSDLSTPIADAGAQRDQMERLEALKPLEEFVRRRLLPAFNQLMEIFDSVREELHLGRQPESIVSELAFHELSLRYRTDHERLLDVLVAPDANAIPPLYDAVSSVTDMYDRYCRVLTYTRQIAQYKRIDLTSRDDYQNWQRLNNHLADEIYALASHRKYGYMAGAVETIHSRRGRPL